MRITERTPPKPPSSADAARAPRQKRQRAAKKILDDRAKDGTPRNVRVERVAVTLNPSPGLLRACVCGHENWKWLDICARCKKALPDA